jgi:hypothetical protein
MLASITGPVIEASSFYKEPNRVGTTFILPEDGNRSSFRKIMVFKETLEDGQSSKTRFFQTFVLSINAMYQSSPKDANSCSVQNIPQF